MNPNPAAARYAGKVALVTGGGSGLGEACCRRLAAEGAQVAVLDVDVANGERVAADVNGRFVRCDVADAEAVEWAVTEVVARFGRLDVAVNNAGIAGTMQPLTEYPVPTWDRVIAVNLSSVFYCLRAQIPQMLKGGRGAIVNMASTMGGVAYPSISAYVAAKHGVVGLTKAAALEWSGQGIRVNAVGPSWIRTPLTTAALPEEAWAQLDAAHPMKRCATPEEVAATVAFLGSDEAGFTTGAYYVIDGGWTAA